MTISVYHVNGEIWCVAQLVDDLDELGLEGRGAVGVGRHSCHWRAARSFMISSAPPPIIITFTSR